MLAFSSAALPADAAAPTRVETQRFGFSNVYLLREQGRWLAVDTPDADHCGAYMDWVERTVGAPAALGGLVLTHGHADHAGCARDLQWSWRMPVIAGADEAERLASGRNTPLTAATTLGALLRPKYEHHTFQPLAIDVPVRDRLDLAAYGIRGSVWQAGGHTPGSLVLVTDRGAAFVGDLLMGGVLGGVLARERPATHYFSEQADANRRAIARLLRASTQVIYPGHGGPLATNAVRQWFARSDETLPPHERTTPP
jgi:hydroxyacylglutathione hydrolase